MSERGFGDEGAGYCMVCGRPAPCALHTFSGTWPKARFVAAPAPVVSMVNFKGTLIVATTEGVFRLSREDGRFYPLEFVTDGSEPTEPLSRDDLGRVCSDVWSTIYGEAANPATRKE